MKKLFLFSVAALAFAACSNDEVVSENTTTNQQKEISFAPLAKPGTRAAVQGTSFPETNTMEVVAYQTDPVAYNYFTKFTFKKDATTWRAWNGSAFAPKYWPLSDAKLNFFAVSGAGVDNADITINGTLLKTDVADVNFAKADATGAYLKTTQSDIMYAFGRGYVKKDGNALYFNRADAGADVPVSMVFKHAMSLIKFQVKAADPASQAITINSITVSGASYTGKLKLTSEDAITANTGEPTITVAWTPDDAEDHIVPNISGPLTASYAPADGGADGTWASLIAVPNATKGFASFTVNYTFDGHTYDYTYTPSVDVPFVAGTVYTYKLNFQLHEITVAPEVTAWTDTPVEINIP